MFTNEDRADSVHDAISTFADYMGLDTDIEADGPATTAGDMICNILHWVQRQTGSREEALLAVKDGLANYVTETMIDYDADDVDELGPDAFVSIEVSCNDTCWTASTGQDPSIIEP